ncbi:hypothetical protein ACFE04_001000 [Oxalis oulophora]
MAAFIKLEDSPMFQKQVFSLEKMGDELKDRCQGLLYGCKKFMTALGEACIGDSAFAESLETFCGGEDDPFSVSIGGPIMSKFIHVFHELSSHKELLRSQVEHVLVDRLMYFMNTDLQGAKESRRQFEKARHAYDQARERFVSLKKSTRDDIIAELEEDLQNSKSAFEKSRFNLVNALVNVESKKKFEFLESVSAIMDGHLRYFKLGYDLLREMEPFIHQVLTYAQQSKEQTNIEQDKLAKRIQEFRTQAEFDSMCASSNMEPPANADAMRVVSTSSYKNVEAIMQSAANGEVQTIKQGYLLKRSSNLRGDWKRRFFVLDGRGTLYYYRNKGAKPMGSTHHYSGSAENNSGVFRRFRARHNRSSSFNEESLGCRTVDLSTSTIKMDAEDTDLRLCFRLISPVKMYTLQAENGADRIDWVNKITAVITSLLNSRILQQSYPGQRQMDHNDFSLDVRPINSNSLEDDFKTISISSILRSIPGNEVCAECNALEPDWASLNLGILLCIECSGVHRNLGVHISKVRSLTLDVRVWEPTILDLFNALGNAYCNSIWEGLLLVDTEGVGESNSMITSISKPCASDSIYQREKYIQAKYVEKSLVMRTANMSSATESIWEAVKANNLREVYRLIVTSDSNIVNTKFDDIPGVTLHHQVEDWELVDLDKGNNKKECDPAACQKLRDSSQSENNCLQGCALLHLACQCGNQVMVELLLQFGADANRRDFHGRTPLHHCISTGNNTLAKFLLRRGAIPSIKDGGGQSSLERAMEMGAITDEGLFILLAET